jgi:hypothetical protein
LSADQLHNQAVTLRASFRNGRLTLYSENAKAQTWDATSKATFLLCAVALENVIKCFLIYEYPDMVSSGILGRDIKNHRLSELANKSTLIPYKQRDRWVLQAFESGNESWMRYPCGRNAADMAREKNFDQKLWNAYLRVMSLYGGKLKKLLFLGWKGPHVFDGNWDVKGEWLGHIDLDQKGFP